MDHGSDVRWGIVGPGRIAAIGITASPCGGCRQWLAEFRIPEVALAVTELLGMTADQFFQVVLLPQGEFARFLRADTDQRERLLEQLFDTSRFGSIEEWFAETRRRSAADLRERHEGLRRIAGRLAQAAGLRTHAPERPDPE